MTKSTGAALTVVDLVIRDQAGIAVVDGVSFTVQHGQPLIVIGETGSGKSLIAQALLGLLPAGFSAQGTIAIGEGLPIAAGNADALKMFWAREIVLIPQEPSRALDPTATIGRQLALNVPSSRSSDALAAVDLPINISSAHPFRLSGGMAQRVLVATALASTASLVVADEPTKGLDEGRVEIAVDLLRRLLRDGRALVVITHDPAVAEAFPDGTIAVLYDGAIAEMGPASQLLGAPSHAYTRAWLDARPMRWPIHAGRSGASGDVVTVGDLAFAYPGQRPLFEDVTFSVARGDVLALVGPSGSGKSTLGDVLLGLKRPSAGFVRWGDARPHADSRALKRLRQLYQKLHQDPVATFLPGRALGRQLNDLKDVMPGTGSDFEQRLHAILERLKLRRELLARLPDEVSGGEAQRLALARLLMLRPALIVADEPTSRLDPIVQRDVMALLREIVDEQGLGLVLISHDRGLVRAVTDRIVQLGSRQSN